MPLWMKDLQELNVRQLNGKQDTDFSLSGHNHGGVYQPVDADLTAIAALTSAADKVPYFTGAGTAALMTVSSFARTLLDDADAATMRATLGVGAGTGDLVGPAAATDGAIMLFDGVTGKLAKNSAYTPASFQAADAELAALAGLVSAADRLPYFTGSGTASLATFTASARALLALDIAAANDFLVGTGAGTAAKKTLAETKTILGIDNIDLQTMTQMSGQTIDGTWRDFVPSGITLVNEAAYAFQLKVVEGSNTILATGQFIWSTSSPAVAWDIEIPMNQLQLYATGGKQLFLKLVGAGSAAIKFQLAGSAAFTTPTINGKFRRII